jgi:hypothetical protein
MTETRKGDDQRRSGRKNRLHTAVGNYPRLVVMTKKKKEREKNKRQKPKIKKMETRPMSSEK